jgi:hypothetical protein
MGMAIVEKGNVTALLKNLKIVQLERTAVTILKTQMLCLLFLNVLVNNFHPLVNPMCSHFYKVIL